MEEDALISFREAQIGALGEQRVKAFRDRLTDFLESHRRPTSPIGLIAADFSIHRCGELGLTRENDIADYGYRVIAISMEWEKSAPFAVYASILSDLSIPAERRFAEMRQAEIRDEFNPFSHTVEDGIDEPLFQSEPTT